MISVKFTRDEKLLCDEFKRGLVGNMVIYAIFCALISGIGLVLLLAHMNKTVSVIFIVFGIVLYIALLSVSVISKKKKLQKQVGKKAFDDAEIIFGDNAVYRVGEIEKTYDYKDFFKLKCEESYLFLYLNKYEFITVPKSACENPLSLEEFLKDKIGKASV